MIVSGKEMIQMAGFFGLFDYTSPGKGVSEEELDKQGLALYFDILGRRLGKFVCLNVLFFIFSLPVIVINWFISGYLRSLLFGGGGMFVVLYIDIALVLLAGSGAASAAMTYVIRKLANDTHAWVWTDFKDGLKSNFVQGTVAYVINTFVIVLLAFAIKYYMTMVEGPMSIFLTSIVTVIGVIFMMMQIYVYQIMASVKLKLKDIYRNALLLTIGKLPVSIAAIAVAAVVLYLYNLVVYYEFSIAAVILIIFTLPVFTQVFITNNTINKYVVEPGMKEQND